MCVPFGSETVDLPIYCFFKIFRGPTNLSVPSFQRVHGLVYLLNSAMDLMTAPNEVCTREIDILQDLRLRRFHLWMRNPKVLPTAHPKMLASPHLYLVTLDSDDVKVWSV